MSRNRIYVFLIGILLVSNLALVAFFVLNKPEKKEVRRDRPGSYMKDSLKSEVGFNDQQMAEYDKQVDVHRQSMKPLFEDITKTKENFYRLLMQPGTPDSVLNNAANQIGEKQKLIDMKIFTHFQNIRQLCTPSQLPSFDTLIQHVVHRMIFPMRRPDSKGDSAALKK
jgi:periplasmic protein CpxP/Spy